MTAWINAEFDAKSHTILEALAALGMTSARQRLRCGTAKDGSQRHESSVRSGSEQPATASCPAAVPCRASLMRSPPPPLPARIGQGDHRRRAESDHR
jgi:hypothetical protein